MPSVFISYSHDSGNSSFGEKVAGLAASLLEDGIEVFFDQNRGTEEEKVPWPIWMEDKIEVADFVLLVCTELYLKKVRQQVAVDTGNGVLWEANIIYNKLYLAKLNTTKFVPVTFDRGDRTYIPVPLQGISSYVLDSDEGYARLLALLTGQHRTHFPAIGPDTPVMPQKMVKRLFAKPNSTLEAAAPAQPPPEVKPVTTPRLKLKPDVPPPPRHDIRGLDWYEECDAEHFLGRDKDADSILALLISNPILRLVGPSGVGKSSLVRAGLLKKMREFGWRACVVRPFDDPSRRLPEQISELLMEGGGSLSAPLDSGRFREEIASLLTVGGATRLVLVLDQFEDIVSPMASEEAMDCMRNFLRGLWQNKDTKPYLRVVVVYRTDADARLGRLWQEISGRPEGLPYFPVSGLSAEMAGDIIRHTALVQSWQVEAGIPDVLRQLVAESHKLDFGGDVFPVYLQILLKQAQESGGFQAAIMEADGSGMSGLIGAYLQRSLMLLKARGGDWSRCGHVLEALSRSSGIKAALSLQELARETCINHTALAEILGVLINERLVRPIGHESYEIQHDRLAAAVIENMKEDDREAKAAREFLAAKVPMFERTQSPLSSGELVYLFRHRRHIHPANSEFKVILASLMACRSENVSRYRDHLCTPVGWWFKNFTPKEYLDKMIEIECLSDKGWMPLHERRWVENLPIEVLIPYIENPNTNIPIDIRIIGIRLVESHGAKRYLPLLRKLANDECQDVCHAAIESLISFDCVEDHPLLRSLIKSDDKKMRHLALRNLKRIVQIEDLPLLRKLIKDEEWEVSELGSTALKALGRDENLSLFKSLAEEGEADISYIAINVLENLSPSEALSILRNFVSSKDETKHFIASRALDRTQKVEHLPFLRVLVKSENTFIRQAATIALIGLAQTEDLELLRFLTKDENKNVRRFAAKALGSFLLDDDLSLIRTLAKSESSNVRSTAIDILGAYLREEDIAVFRQLINDEDEHVSSSAAIALAGFSRSEDIPLLKFFLNQAEQTMQYGADIVIEKFSKNADRSLLQKMSKDKSADFRCAAASEMGRLEKADSMPLLLKLARDEVSKVRDAAMRTILLLSPDYLRDLAGDKDSEVRHSAIDNLKTILQPADVLLLRRLALDESSNVRHSAVMALGKYASKDDLHLLSHLAASADGNVATEATKLLLNLLDREELEEFLISHEKTLMPGSLEVLDEWLYMPEWMKWRANNDIW